MAARSCPAASSRCWRSRARFAQRSQAAGHGRADRGPGAGHRRARSSAMLISARRGRRDRGPGHRAEYRRRHRGLRPRRDHGQRPHQPHHGGARARRRPRAAAAALGVGRHARRRAERWPPAEAAQSPSSASREVFRVERGGADATQRRSATALSRRSRELPNRWNVPVTGCARRRSSATAPADDAQKVFAIPLRRADRPHRAGRRHLRHQGQGIALHRRPAEGAAVFRCAPSISRPRASRRAPTCPRCRWQRMHPRGTSAVLSGDRGQSVAAMAEAFARWIEREPRIGGIISAGGSGGTTLATAGMRGCRSAFPRSWSRPWPQATSAAMSAPADIMMLIRWPTCRA